MYRFIGPALGLAAALLFVEIATAVPNQIQYQGYLESDGVPYDGQVEIQIELYDSPADGSRMWGPELHAAVVVDGGIFSAQLGSILPLDPSLFESLTPWIQTTVDGEVLTPRTALVAVPYSFVATKAARAAVADSAVVSGSSSGADSNWNVSGSGIYYEGGNVGVGNDDPARALDVRSGAPGSPAVRLGDLEGFSELIAGSVSALRVRGQDGVDKLNVRQDGDVIVPGGTVVIGASTPIADVPLEIDGDDTSVYLVTRDPDGIVPRLHFRNTTNGNDWILQHAEDRMHIQTEPATPGSEVITFTNTKRVGIGTIDPPQQLSVTGGIGFANQNATDKKLYSPVDGVLEWLTHGQAAGHAFVVSDQGAPGVVLDADGAVSVLSEGQTGVTLSGNGDISAIGRVSANDITMTGYSEIICTDRLHLQANDELHLQPFQGQGPVVIGGGGGDGRLRVNVVEILGGSDIAEPFSVRPGEYEHPVPGMVVVIDPSNPGSLVPSARAYDQRVAGVISGAGGVRPGVTLRQEGCMEGDLPVALTGRVWAFCDATDSPIEPGDLLTTSETPGHGMAVRDRERANGAILGKAMTPLETGTGLVLVLVSLQ